MAHQFPMGSTFPIDIKPGTGQRIISPEQVRYAFRIICMYENITYLGLTNTHLQHLNWNILGT